MTFVLPVEQMAPEVRPGIEMAVKGARASGTPFISFYAPAQIMAMAREAGSAMSGTSRPPCSRSVLRGRTDGLSLSSAEEFLIAGT